jgi:hypothetical protein
MSSPPHLDWYEVHVELLEFGRVIGEVNGWTRDEMVDYFEKPWKWTPEYKIWDGCRCPTPGDKGWDIFLRKLDKENR